MRSIVNVIVLIACAGPVLAQSALVDNLRKGVTEEEVKKNLPAAIERYTAVVKAFEDQTRLVAPKTQAKDDVSAKYRDLLALQVEYAVKNREAQRQKYELGMVPQLSIFAGERTELEARLKLAAFDAGLGGAAGLDSAASYPGSPESRLAAATALFRMAECYRKLKKTGQANTAHARVITDFPEQVTLATQSRAKLPEGYQIPSTPRQQAFAEVGIILARYATVAKMTLDFHQKQYQLGAIADMDLYLPRMEAAEAESRLAAWKAGQIELALRPVSLGAAPSASDTSELEQRRQQLQSTLDAAVKKGMSQQAQQLSLELKKLQDQLDAIRKAPLPK
jgi:hypothetical protein